MVTCQGLSEDEHHGMAGMVWRQAPAGFDTTKLASEESGYIGALDGLMDVLRTALAASPQITS
jgi:hypothetical protein